MKNAKNYQISEFGFIYTDSKLINFKSFGLDKKELDRTKENEILLLSHRYWMHKSSLKFQDFNYCFAAITEAEEQINFTSLEKFSKELAKDKTKDAFKSLLLFDYLPENFKASKKFAELNKQFIHKIDLFDTIQYSEEEQKSLKSGSWALISNPTDNILKPAIIWGFDKKIMNLLTITPNFEALTSQLALKGMTFENKKIAEIKTLFGAELIDSLQQAYTDLWNHRAERLERYIKKAEAAESKAKKAKDAKAKTKEAFNKKLALLQAAKTEKALKIAYPKAKSKDTFGSISKIDLINLSKEYKALLAKFKPKTEAKETTPKKETKTEAKTESLKDKAINEMQAEENKKIAQKIALKAKSAKKTASKKIPTKKAMETNKEADAIKRDILA